MSLSGYVRWIISGVGEALDTRQTVSGSGGLILDESITDGATDQLVEFAFTLAQLRALYLVTDRALTLKTNDDLAPQETLTLAAGQPFVYVPGNGIASPFADDVIALYVTNASGGTAHLEGRALVDATP